jgi:hypothetical protein
MAIFAVLIKTESPGRASDFISIRRVGYKLTNIQSGIDAGSMDAIPKGKVRNGEISETWCYRTN